MNNNYLVILDGMKYQKNFHSTEKILIIIKHI